MDSEVEIVYPLNSRVTETNLEVLKSLNVFTILESMLKHNFASVVSAA